MQKLTNNTNIPISLAVWLATDWYDHDDRPNLISTTSLLKPIREIVLARRHKALDKIEDISTRLASAFGTAVHDAIEKAWITPGNPKKVMALLGYPKSIIDRIIINPSIYDLIDYPECVPVYLEQRSEKEIEGFIISGKFDFVIEASVEDFKTTGTYGYMNGSNTQKYIEQASIYRWLNPTIILGNTANIQLIFTDWSSMEARKNSSYPQTKTLQQTILLMPIEETEYFISNRLKQIKNLEPESAELPLCSSEELWQKADVWKYYKDPTKKARSTKNFDNLNEAISKLMDDGNCGEVVHIPGKVMRCNYCSVPEVCTQYTDLKQQGLI
jgi:hypothetical protein